MRATSGRLAIGFAAVLLVGGGLASSVQASPMPAPYPYGYPASVNPYRIRPVPYPNPYYYRSRYQHGCDYCGDWPYDYPIGSPYDTYPDYRIRPYDYRTIGYCRQCLPPWYYTRYCSYCDYPMGTDLALGGLGGYAYPGMASGGYGTYATPSAGSAVTSYPSMMLAPGASTGYYPAGYSPYGASPGIASTSAFSPTWAGPGSVGFPR